VFCFPLSFIVWYRLIGIGYLWAQKPGWERISPHQYNFRNKEQASLDFCPLVEGKTRENNKIVSTFL
jgi:hypothetical protein